MYVTQNNEEKTQMEGESAEVITWGRDGKNIAEIISAHLQLRRLQ